MAKPKDLANSINTGPVAGFRNLIINGNPVVNQRGYVTGTATGAANQYTLDRWRVVTSGQNLAFTSSSGVVTCTAPAGGVEQVVEGASIIGGTYTLSWSGTATATIGGTAVANGGSVILTGGSNATVRLSSGTFTRVQLEPGTVATVFEPRPYGTELRLCQRYYCKTFAQATAPAQNVGIDTGEFNFSVLGANIASGGRWLFPVTMRTTPGTITLFNPAAANAQIRNRNTSADFSSSTTINASDTGVFVYGTTPAGSSIGNAAAVHLTASAEL